MHDAPMFFRCGVSSQQFAHVVWPPIGQISTLVPELQHQKFEVPAAMALILATWSTGVTGSDYRPSGVYNRATATAFSAVSCK